MAQRIEIQLPFLVLGWQGNDQDSIPLDKFNRSLMEVFGPDCEIDWRDENTVWVTLNDCTVVELPNQSDRRN